MSYEVGVVQAGFLVFLFLFPHQVAGFHAEHVEYAGQGLRRRRFFQVLDQLQLIAAALQQFQRGA